MKQQRIFLLIPVIFAAFLSGCGNITRDGDRVDRSDETETFSGVDDLGESISVFYLFPSPVEILEKFENTEIGFVPDLVNAPEHEEKYLTSRSKALNLGIYITDLAYTSMLGRTSLALKYPDVIQSLSADLGISNESFKLLIRRIQDNISVKDSLVQVANDLYFEMVEYLESGGQTRTIAEISSGAYIESLFIGMNSVSVYSDDHPVVKEIIDMKYPFENLLAQAETADDEESENILIEYLNQVKDIFDELEPEESQTEIIRNEDGEIEISGGISFKMDEKSFLEMKDRIFQIRKKITDTPD